MLVGSSGISGSSGFGIETTQVPFKLPEAHALATVDGDKIIETAQTYSDWGYWEIGTCTGFVTRTLNKLGIGESIVGIHPYDINKVQPEGTEDPR